MVPPPPTPRRNPQTIFLIWLLPVAALSVLAWRLLTMKREDVPIHADELSVFDLAQPPRPDEPPPAEPYLSEYERELARRKPQGGAGAAGLAGLVPETTLRAPQDSRAPEGGASGLPSAARKRLKAAAAPAVGPEERRRELAAIQKYGGLLRQEHRRMDAITRKYWKQYKIVREVDAHFSAMPRFMGLYKKFQQDNDPFELWRGAVALPEFRQGMRKFVVNPEVHKVGLMMVAEALQKKPPEPIYKEAVRFVTKDRAISRYMATEVLPQVVPRLPSLLLETPLPPGSNPNAITELAGEIAGPSSIQAGQARPH